MAIGYFTLSGTYLAYGDTPASGTVQIDGLPQVIVDTTGDKIKVGPKKVTLDTTGSFSIQLPTDSTSGNSATLGYRVTARLKHANVDPVTFWAPAANATLKMSAVTPAAVGNVTPFVGPAGPAGPASTVPGPPGPAIPADQLASLSATFTAASVTLHDSFSTKPDGSFTTAESGQTWVRTGSNPLVIVGNKMTLGGTGTGAGYTTLDLGALPEVIAAGVTFSAGTTGAVATLLVSKGPSALDLNNLGVHYYFGPTGWTLQVREGGETPFPQLGTGTFATPLAQDDTTVHKVYIQVSGNTARILHPDGSETVHTDPRIGANSSGWVAWEVFRSDVAQTLPKFTQVWAMPKQTKPRRFGFASLEDLSKVAERLRGDLTPGNGDVTARGGLATQVKTGAGNGGLSSLPAVSFGSAGDVALYRASASRISTQQYFEARAGQSDAIRTDVDNTEPAVFFGSAFDTRVRRDGADRLRMGTGDSFKVDGTWNGGTLQLGGNFLWVDASGNLRIKSSAPTSDTDGIALGAGGGGGGGTLPGVQSATTQTSLASSTAETVMAAYTIPANTATVGQTMRLTAGGQWDNIATSGTLTLRLRVGGVTGVQVAGLTLPASASASTNKPWFLESQFTWRVIGASGRVAGSAVVSGSLGSNSTAPTMGTNALTTNANSTTALDYVLTAQWATADPGNVLRVEIANFELVKA